MRPFNLEEAKAGKSVCTRDGRTGIVINPARRNLSGIYIFDTLPGDAKRQPTCIEDCNEATRLEWLHSLSVEALQNCLDVIYGDIERIFSDRSIGIIFSEDTAEDTAIRDDYIRELRRLEERINEPPILCDAAD